MRRFAIAMIGLILAGCAALAQPTPVPPPATISPLVTASPVAAVSCLVNFGLGSFPEGTLATFGSIDGWSLGQGQLAVNIEGTLLLSSTSRLYDRGIITETMRVSTGQASGENLQRLQGLIGSAEFAELLPCYNSDATDARSIAFSANTPDGLKAGRASTGGLPPALEEFFTLMDAISVEATIPVSTCVYVTHVSHSGREKALDSCE